MYHTNEASSEASSFSLKLPTPTAWQNSPALTISTSRNDCQASYSSIHQYLIQLVQHIIPVQTEIQQEQTYREADKISMPPRLTGMKRIYAFDFYTK
jgi:hypothetical protein